jgi:hypothetical protein
VCLTDAAVSSTTLLFAGTDAAVSITLYGAAGEAGPFKLAAPGRNCFEQGSCDVFSIKAASKLGQLLRLKVGCAPASCVTAQLAVHVT